MTGLRTAVAEAAGRRCECDGQCGRSHAARGIRRDPSKPARCLAQERDGAELHAVPRVAVPLHVAARLHPDELMAVCDRCAAGVAAVHARELAARPMPPSVPLFTLGGAA